MTTPEPRMRRCAGCGYRFVPASADQWDCGAICERRAALAGVLGVL